MTPAAWERPRPHPALPSKLASERSEEGKKEGGKDGVGKKERGTKEKRIFSCAPSLLTAPVRNLRSLHFKSGQVNVPTHRRAGGRGRAAWAQACA